MKKIFYSTAIIFSLFLTSSCKKDSAEETTDPTGKSYELDYKANALIQAETTANEMEFILRTVPKNRIQFPNGGTFLGVGAITRVTNPNDLEIITLDFGTGAMCTDGKHRSGKLVVTIYPSDNDDITLRPENYKVDNSQVFGNYSFVLLLPENRTYFDGNGALVKDGLSNIEFDFNRETKQVEGASTTDITDDVFDRLYTSFKLHVTDNGKTTDIEASPLTTTAVSKLKYSCSNKYLPVNGQFKVKSAPTPGTIPNSSLSEEFYLTFGNGNCGDKPFTQKSL